MDFFEESQRLLPSSARAKRKKSRRNTLIAIFIVIVVTVSIILLASLGGKSTDEIPLLPEEEDLLGGNDTELEGSNYLKLSYRDNYEEEDYEEGIQKSPIVRIRQGRVQGRVSKSRQGRSYYSFFSIPYGKAERFEPPKPADNWSRRSILDASQVRTSCVAWNKTSLTVIGSEDCLHLHIYTPKLLSRRSPDLPVMVYILGGAFKSGRASRYGPDYFMDEDVILVFMEYRLGAFGHLNTGDSTVTGNQSFKDQSLALRWVNDNIHKFGGNRKKIILFGNSSGSMSVHGHLLSHMSAGLFQGAISESGAVIGPNVPSILMTNPGIVAKNLGQEVGCPNVSDSQQLVKCLRSVDASVLASVNRPDIAWDLTRESLPANGDLSQIFLTDTPMNLMRQGRINKVPWIVGVNSGEKFGDAYDLIRTPELVRDLNGNWSQVVVEKTLQLNDPDGKLSERIKKLYFGGVDSVVDKGQKDRLTDLLSDRVWIHPSRTSAMLHAGHNQTVYVYYWSKEPLVSHMESKKDGFLPPHGTGHGDELQYLFTYEPFPYITLSSESAQFSIDMVKTWVSFAKSGGIPQANGVEKWEPITPSQNGMVWYQLNDRNLTRNIEPFTERMDFWDSIQDLYE